LRRLVLFLMPIGIGAILIASAYGFMAHNTVSAQSIGAGGNQVQGYNVQLLHVDYVIPPYNYITHIQFTMDPAPHTVQVWFDGGSGAVYSNQGTGHKCFVTSGDVVDCYNMHESDVTTTAMHVAGAD
jgi:hypothetical protein